MFVLKYYPILLAIVTMICFVIARICALREVGIRNANTPREKTPLMEILAWYSQSATSLLLLYYACTFRKSGSEFTHQLMVHSLVHQTLVISLLSTLVYDSFHMTRHLCCHFPNICVVACYTFWCAMVSIESIHRLKHIQSRVMTATFSTFHRYE